MPSTCDPAQLLEVAKTLEHPSDVLKELRQLPEQRSLELRNPDKPVPDLKSRSYYSEATMGQVVGSEANEECGRCKKKNGHFKQCIVVPGRFNAACANCHFGHRDVQCSLYNGQGGKSQIAGTKRKAIQSSAPQKSARIDNDDADRELLAALAQDALGGGTDPELLRNAPISVPVADVHHELLTDLAQDALDVIDPRLVMNTPPIPLSMADVNHEPLTALDQDALGFIDPRLLLNAPPIPGPVADATNSQMQDALHQSELFTITPPVDDLFAEPLVEPIANPTSLDLLHVSRGRENTAVQSALPTMSSPIPAPWVINLPFQESYEMPILQPSDNEMETAGLTADPIENLTGIEAPHGSEIQEDLAIQSTVSTVERPNAGLWAIEMPVRQRHAMPILQQFPNEMENPLPDNNFAIAEGAIQTSDDYKESNLEDELNREIDDLLDSQDVLPNELNDSLNVSNNLYEGPGNLENDPNNWANAQGNLPSVQHNQPNYQNDWNFWVRDQHFWVNDPDFLVDEESDAIKNFDERWPAMRDWLDNNRHLIEQWEYVPTSDEED